MTPQQMIDFDARREAVLRHQLKTNPNLRALRRDRRVAFAAGVVRYFATLGILMFLVKAFLISQVGVPGYELIVSPLASHLPPGGLMEQAVAPGPYSILIAETFSSWMEGNWTRQTGLEGIERIGPGSSNS
jgi:hypothetical protein